jgi:hypothetical protein
MVDSYERARSKRVLTVLDLGPPGVTQHPPRPSNSSPPARHDVFRTSTGIFSLERKAARFRRLRRLEANWAVCGAFTNDERAVGILFNGMAVGGGKAEGVGYDHHSSPQQHRPQHAEAERDLIGA